MSILRETFFKTSSKSIPFSHARYKWVNFRRGSFWTLFAFLSSTQILLYLFIHFSSPLAPVSIQRFSRDNLSNFPLHFRSQFPLCRGIKKNTARICAQKKRKFQARRSRESRKHAEHSSFRERDLLKCLGVLSFREHHSAKTL